MGPSRFRRTTLLAGSFLLFLYLLINLLLNVSVLPDIAVQRLEALTDRPVRVGYLYLNVRLNPVVHRIRVGHDDQGDVALSLRRVELNLDWSRLVGLTETSRRVGILKSLHVDDATARTAGLGMFASGSTSEGAGQVPIFLRRWSVELNHLTAESVWIRGDTGYLKPGEPARFHVNEIGSRSADVDLTVGSERIRGTIHELVLPDAIWALKGDHWEGKMAYQRSDTTGYLQLNLHGSPGRLREVSLPPLDLSVAMTVGDTRSRLTDFSLAASYLRVSVTGTIQHDPLRLNLSGRGMAPLRRQVQRLLLGEMGNYVSVRHMEPASARFRISGPPGDPEVDGTLSLESVHVDLHVQGRKYEIALTGIAGEVGRDRIRLTDGQVRMFGGRGSLRTGELTLQSGRVRGGISWEYRVEPLSAGKGRIPWIPDGIGPFQSVHLPVNLTFRVGPEAARGRLTVREGRLNLAAGRFEDLQFHLDLDPGAMVNPSFEGAFRDPDGNLWDVSGRILGPIFLRGHSVVLDRWIDVVGAGLPWVENGFSLEGIDVRSVLPPGYWKDGDYSVKLDFAGVRLLYPAPYDTSISLSGAMELKPDRVLVEDLGIRDSGSGELQVWGDVKHDGGFQRGTWDLKFKGNDVDLASLLRARFSVPPSLQTALDLAGVLRGSFREPRYRMGFYRGSLRWNGFRADRIRGTVEGDSTTLRSFVDTMRFAHGEVTGRLVWNEAERLSVKGRLDRVDLNAVSTPESWVGRNLTGILTASFDLNGRVGEADSWSGTVRAEGRGVQLDHFPRVGGIEEIARVEALRRPIVVDPVRAEFPVRNGRLKMRNLTLTAPDLSMDVNGEVRFNGTLDLRFVLILKDQMLQRFLQDVLGDVYRNVGLSNQPRRLKCPFTARGPLMNPRWDLEHETISKNFRENLVNSLLTEHLGKPLNELLEEIPFFR